MVAAGSARCSPVQACQFREGDTREALKVLGCDHGFRQPSKLCRGGLNFLAHGAAHDFGPRSSSATDCIAGQRYAWSGATSLGSSRRCRDPAQHLIEIGAGEVTAGEQNASDGARVVDRVERIGVQQDEVGNLVLRYGAHVRLTT